MSKPSIVGVYNSKLVQTNEECIEVFRNAKQCTEIGFDTESNTKDWWKFKPDDIAGISLYTPVNNTAYYIPINQVSYNPEERNINAELVKSCLQNLLKGTKPPKLVGGNLKFDWHVISKCLGIDLSLADYADVLLRSHLSHINFRHSVKALGAELYEDGDVYEQGLIQVKKMLGITASDPRFWDYRFYPLSILFMYAACDSFLAWAIYKNQERENLLTAFGDYVATEHDMARVLFSAEEHGIKINVPYLEEQQEIFTKKIIFEDALIQALAERIFNINSPKQLQDVLYNNLKLPKQYKRVKRSDGSIETAISTDKTALNGLLGKHPVVEHILTLRGLQKIKTTYIEGILENLVNSRIYTTFNQFVENSSSLRTGRLSSSDPINFENIPRNDTTIRRAFLPDTEDWYFDYSGQEIRVYTHYSQEPKLVQAFRLGEDVHSRTCEAVFGIPYEEVNAKRKSDIEIERKREIAKRIFFGILYGSGAPRVAAVLAEFGYGYNEREARRLLNNLYSNYPRFRIYADSIKSRLAERGYVKDVFDRRYIPKNPTITYPVGNYLVQGTSSGVLKISTVKLWKHFGTRDYFKNFIHDEIVLDRIPDRKYCKDIIKIMTDFPQLSIPMEVDMSWDNTNWEDKKEVKRSMIDDWIKEKQPDFDKILNENLNAA